MIDREKVIADIEEQIAWIRDNDFHKFPGWGHAVLAMKDALTLLKEQEAKPVNLYGKDDWYGLVCVCPDCNAEWMSNESNTHFCPNCGRLVKWND